MWEYENVRMWKCGNVKMERSARDKKERQTADKCMKCESVKIGNQQLLYAAPLLRCGLCVKTVYGIMWNMKMWECENVKWSGRRTVSKRASGRGHSRVKDFSVQCFLFIFIKYSLIFTTVRNRTQINLCCYHWNRHKMKKSFLLPAVLFVCIKRVYAYPKTASSLSFAANIVVAHRGAWKNKGLPKFTSHR